MDICEERQHVANVVTSAQSAVVPFIDPTLPVHQMITHPVPQITGV